jgi:CRP/FNR family cyclic AMP-dependent transcriptional regulator
VRYPLLEGLDETDQRSILIKARRRRFARNEVIFHEGDPGDSLHLVARGHVAIRIHTPLGDVATVRIVRSGEFFGELAVVAPGPRNATAVALDATATMTLSRDQLTDLRASHDEIDQLLTNALVTEIRRLAVQVVEAMYLPVDTRVWRRLHDLAIVFGSANEPATRIPLTQEVIAQLAGCTRPTANRTLRAGEDAGIIHMQRGRIEILDLEAVGRRGR